MFTSVNNKTVSVFELTGSDVTVFLNNQVISELKETIDSLKYTAICNPKGRILFSLFLYKPNETAYVAVDSTLCDNFLQYVNMRRFRMDLQINKSKYKIAINVKSTQADLTQMKFTDEPDLAVSGDEEFWLFMFQTGLPWITEETTEHFIPQHLNLDQEAVIDFDKGCYPGQEIIARLHFLGNVKKRMQAVEYQSEQPFKVNDKTQISAYEKPLEFCAPSIYHNDKWHSQAIIAV